MNIVAVAEAGAKVEVPAWSAVTTHIPFLKRLNVDPFIEQIPIEAVEYVRAPPLDAVALSFTDPVEKFMVLGKINSIVCGSLVISKDNS
jgi:hypothetical protein